MSSSSSSSSSGSGSYTSGSIPDNRECWPLQRCMIYNSGIPSGAPCCAQLVLVPSKKFILFSIESIRFIFANNAGKLNQYIAVTLRSCSQWLRYSTSFILALSLSIKRERFVRNRVVQYNHNKTSGTMSLRFKFGPSPSLVPSLISRRTVVILCNDS